MATRNSFFTRLLDRLSGTYPNDERTSRINEKGFALCGLFYFVVMALQSYDVVRHESLYVNGMLNPTVLAPPVFGIMLLIMLGITVMLRRKEAPAKHKNRIRLRLSELPRAAASLLSGRSPEDERTVQAFERGFAVCALLGFAFYAICMLLAVSCPHQLLTLFNLCAAPVLVGYVKLRENILTPPRFTHIRLNINNILLRLPVYLLAVIPFLIAASLTLSAAEFLGSLKLPLPFRVSDDNMFVMFWQFFLPSLKFWIHDPWHIPGASVRICALLYLAVVILNEFRVWLFRSQMKKMDAEENDLS